MIAGFTLILFFLAAGTLLAEVGHVPLPGSVLGMLLLLAYLLWRKPADDAPVMRAGDRLLDVLSILFIPAGAGIVTQLGVLRAQWLPLAVGLVIPWAAGLLATGLVAKAFLRRSTTIQADEVAELAAKAVEWEPDA